MYWRSISPFWYNHTIDVKWWWKNSNSFLKLWIKWNLIWKSLFEVWIALLLMTHNVWSVEIMINEGKWAEILFCNYKLHTDNVFLKAQTRPGVQHISFLYLAIPFIWYIISAKNVKPHNHCFFLILVLHKYSLEGNYQVCCKY